MANQDTLGQIVLMDEFLHVFGHDGIVMFVVMERVAMIPQIQSEDLPFEVTCKNFANTSVVLFRAEETMQEDNRISGGLFLFWAENLIREL